MTAALDEVTKKRPDKLSTEQRATPRDQVGDGFAKWPLDVSLVDEELWDSYRLFEFYA